MFDPTLNMEICFSTIGNQVDSSGLSGFLRDSSWSQRDSILPLKNLLVTTEMNCMEHRGQLGKRFPESWSHGNSWTWGKIFISFETQNHLKNPSNGWVPSSWKKYEKVVFYKPKSSVKIKVPATNRDRATNMENPNLHWVQINCPRIFLPMKKKTVSSWWLNQPIWKTC